MSARIKWAVAVFLVVVVGVIAYSSFQATRVRYQVCMSIAGRSHCAVAQGRSPQDAIQSAMEIDCGLLAASRDQLMVCESSQPQSVTPLEK